MQLPRNHPSFELVLLMNSPGKDKTVRVISEAPGFLQLRTEWKELDLADLRNKAKKFAKGEWILSLDIDEILPEHLHQVVLGQIWNAEADEIGIWVATCSENNGKFGLGRSIRLFRNLKRIKWYGRIHEIPFWSFKETDKIKDSPLIILHQGYQSDTINIKKVQRNIHGLAYEIHKAKDSKKYKYYLAEMKLSILHLEELIGDEFQKGVINL